MENTLDNKKSCGTIMDMKNIAEECRQEQNQPIRRLYTQIYRGRRIFCTFVEGEQEEGWELAKVEDYA